MARHTRVRLSLLKALEEDRYDLLPPPTFIKGFLYSYAKYMGLRPETVLDLFEQMTREQTAVQEEKSVPIKKRSRKKIVLGCLLAAVAAAAIAFALIQFLPSTPTEPSGPPPPPMAQEVAPSPAPALAPEAPPPEMIQPENSLPPSVGSQPEQSISLQIKAIERTWIRIQVGDESPREIMLQPGETIFFGQTGRIHLVVGNAGGVDLVFNGKSLERYGKAGEVVTLLFTPQGAEVIKARTE